jgi:hypothetical protein
MPAVVHVKAGDPAVRKQREALAKRVLEQFADAFTDCRLLCFFDDDDCLEFKQIMGESNRALYRRVSDNTAFAGWPEYITDSIFVDDPSSIWRKRVVDQFIYLHGSTCSDMVGMTMSFAHELQHAVQRTTVPELLSANGLVRLLPRTVIQSVGIQWSDIPTEREARAVAKRIAVTLHGSEGVEQFLAQRASTTTDPVDLADLEFIQALNTSTPYILKDETLSLFRRLKNCRAEIEETIEFLKSDPDFESVNLNLFLLGIPDDADQCSGACRSPIPG